MRDFVGSGRGSAALKQHVCIVEFAGVDQRFRLLNPTHRIARYAASSIDRFMRNDARRRPKKEVGNIQTFDDWRAVRVKRTR
jgi:hypothetical protein